MSVQSIHAAIQFQHEHTECAQNWYIKSNYLGFLSVDDESGLVKLAESALALGIKFSIFREPDIDNQITAIALEPGNKSKKLCSNLSLALKEEKEIRKAL
jgi:hypothetical protein